MTSVHEQFLDQGFFLARQYFSLAEMEEFDRIYDLAVGRRGLRGRDRFAVGDFVAQDSLCWPLATNHRVSSLASMALNARVAWIQQADIHLNIGSTMHRDSVDRAQFGRGQDWEKCEDHYAIARIAVYLDGSDTSDSKFIACPASHRLSVADQQLVGTVRGDCLIFDPRLLHGSTKPKAQKRAIFLTYGVPNSHSRRLQSWFVTERSMDLGYKPMPDEFGERLRHAGLELI